MPLGNSAITVMGSLISLTRYFVEVEVMDGSVLELNGQAHTDTYIHIHIHMSHTHKYLKLTLKHFDICL